MKKILSVILTFSLISISSLFSQESRASSQDEGEAGSDSAEAFAIISELKPEEEKNIQQDRTKVTFNANVKSCSIFLNGNMQGRTRLSLSSLIEGYYLLRVEKQGYITKENFVYIERGKEKSYYIELEPSEETQKREEARANRAAAREAEKQAKETADSASDSASASAETSAQTESLSSGDAK